jgi:hypothetical protein
MSSITSCTSKKSDEKKTYISTFDFSLDFYKYTVTFSDKTFVNSGTISLADITGTKCPINRILHETGKKLRPEIDPMNTFEPTCTLRAPKFLIGVYDPISFLHGFIDPTSNRFALYDTNFSEGQLDGRKNGIIFNADGQGAKLQVGPTSGLIQASGGTVQTISAGDASVGTVSIDSGTLSVNIQTSAFNSSTSLVFLTLVQASSPTTILSYTTTGGGFKIVASANPATIIVNWLIIN